MSAIVARADGIPLYAVETVRTLVADGRLVERDGVYAPQGDLTNLAVPETLTALIAARLDALDETDRRIVHDAAVLGQSFTADALAAVLELSGTDLEPRLTGLVRRELFARQMDPRSPERGQYAFVQALIREVAYNTLSKKDRKKLHLAAARYFESLGSDELAGALASHYLAAHANAAEGEEADALAGQARIALRAATTRATDLGAFGQAVAFLDHALEVTSDTAERADLLIQSGAAAGILGHLDDADTRLRRAIELATATGDKDLTARGVTNLGNVLASAYKNTEARDLVEPLLQDTAGMGEREVCELTLALARSLWGLGNGPPAYQLAEEALAIAERRDYPDLVARGLMFKGGLLWSFGRRHEAFAVAEGARKLADEHALTDAVLQTMMGITGGVSELDMAAALDGYREMMALARRTGRRASLLSAVGNLGYAGFKGGVWDEALTEMNALLGDELPANARLVMLNNAAIISVSRGKPIEAELAEMERSAKGMTGRWHGFVADPLANKYMSTGEYKKAVVEYLVVVNDNPGFASEYLYRAARAELWAGDVEEARQHLAGQIDIGGYGPIASARRQVTEAGIAACDGHPSEALALYRDALRNWRESHSVWDEAMTGLDMALLLDPSDPDVAAVIASTREILARLGAKPYLELLERTVAAAGAGGARGARRESTAALPETAPAG